MNEKILGTLKELRVPGVALLITALYLAFLIGLSAALSVLGIAILFVLPFYLILSAFSLPPLEKLCFSFFIGVAVFSIPVYWLGMVISLRLAMIISFILYAGAGLSLHLKKR